MRPRLQRGELAEGVAICLRLGASPRARVTELHTAGSGESILELAIRQLRGGPLVGRRAALQSAAIHVGELHVGWAGVCPSDRLHALRAAVSEAIYESRL